jgi:hypothetical protein
MGPEAPSNARSAPTTHSVFMGPALVSERLAVMLALSVVAVEGVVNDGCKQHR